MILGIFSQEKIMTQGNLENGMPLKVQASVSFFKMPCKSFCSRSMCAHTLKIMGGGFHGVINNPITPILI
jgi:hypothetical protein